MSGYPYCGNEIAWIKGNLEIVGQVSDELNSLTNDLLKESYCHIIICQLIKYLTEKEH